jgi:hypothetical protein
MRSCLVGGLLVLGSCCSENSACENDDDVDGTGDDCFVTLLSRYPLPGATGVFEWSVVDAVIPQTDPGKGTITVTDSAGTPVAGTLTSDLGHVMFRPEAPYTAGATYMATFDWASDIPCPDETWSFTVAETPVPPVSDPGTVLAGTSWQLDLSDSRAAFPLDMEQILLGYMEVDLLLGVLAVNGTDLDLRASSTDTARTAQDLTSPTTDFTASFARDPFVVAEQAQLPLVIFGDELTAMDLELTGAYDEAAGQWVEVALDTVIDTRELVDIVISPDAEPNGVCELFSSTFGVDCHACPVPGVYPEGGDFCVTMFLDGMTMTPFPNPIVEVP